MISSAPRLRTIIMVGGARGGDHAGAEMFGELDGKARDAAGAALDQDGLARLQLERVFDGANRRQSGKRQRRGIDMATALRVFLATMAALIAIFSA